MSDQWGLYCRNELWDVHGNNIYPILFGGLSLVFVFIFLNFLFFRILSAAMFDDPLTIWACALTSILIGVALSILGPVTVLASYINDDGSDKPSISWIVIVTFVACIASCVFAYLIALGFSEELYRQISYWGKSRDFWEQDLFWFCIMISIPVICQIGFAYLAWQYMLRKDEK